LILHLTDKNLFNEVYKIKASHETQKTIYKLAIKAKKVMLFFISVRV
jgi:hypothetical protein